MVGTASYLVSLYFWLFSFSFKAYPFTAKMDFPPDTKGGKSILEVFMERILNYQVSSDDLSDHTSCTVQSLLQHRLHLTKKEISRAKFLKNGILADNLPVYINTHLQKGQLLSVCIERTQMEDCTLIPYAHPLTVLYENEDMICIDKPPGIAVHPSHGHYSDTIVNALAAYFYQQNNWIIPRIIGRLDKDTSGLLVFAKNQPAAARLTAQHKDGRFLRTYLALVEGIPKKARGRIDAPIGPVSSSLMKQEVRPDGAFARTFYTHVHTFFSDSSSCSLMRVQIDTGRTHQIRVHMQSIGHPLLGDHLYQENPMQPPFSCYFQRSALHSASVTCFQPFTGQPISIHAPLPKDFARFFTTYGYVPDFLLP